MAPTRSRRKRPSFGVISVSRPHLSNQKERVLHRSVEVRRDDTGRIISSSNRIVGAVPCPPTEALPLFDPSLLDVDYLNEDDISPGDNLPDLDEDGPWDANLVHDPSVDKALPDEPEVPVTIQASDPSTLLAKWLPYRQEYLDEVLRHDGRNQCFTCACGKEGRYRCCDCLYSTLHCKDCLLIQHRSNPFHRISEWNNGAFVDTFLRDVGLEIQLGHNGARCICPSSLQDNFIVVNSNGVHPIALRFCECHGTAGASEHRIQLLRAGWLPATVSRPQSAFAFEMLDTFHLLTLQSKISAHDYYTALEYKTNNVGEGIKNRYDNFLFAVRIWRHLKMCKRAGRGHDPAGVDVTMPGSCAVECPACPHPLRNLPKGWDQAPQDRRWLYSLILTIDANFRLKNKDRAVRNDPALGDGWGHWVPEKPYHEYLQAQGRQDEPNMCESDLHAVDHANTRFSKGYRSTGAGAVLCARHTMVRKNGLGDLQRGERYANIDFIVFSSLVGTLLACIIFSYDIVCQWSRNLQKRHRFLPPLLRLPETALRSAKFVIPKFHIYGHGSQCQTKYSLNFLKYSARTNGEEPERWWAHINPVSMSTREMGPGSRHDTIDDHAAAWNWHKTTGLGTALLRQFRMAVLMAAKHHALFLKFNSGFSSHVQEKWEDMVKSWEEDPSCRNPFEESTPLSSQMVQVRLEFAAEEMAKISRGEVTTHNLSPFAFLQLGLDLEEQQRTLRAAASDKQTPLVAAELQEKRNTLARRLEAYYEIQALHMPGIADVRASTSSSLSQPESHPLHLPSSTSTSMHKFSSLAKQETCLRLAQAEDALVELRRLLRITTGLWQYKFKQVGPSQRASTRARAMIERFRVKVTRTAERYRAARATLISLDPTGSWILRLKDLKASDVKGPERDDDDNTGEGRRELSWIWLTPRDNGANATCEGGLDEALRVEWTKSRARAARWSEEVTLVVEEMRRVLCFLKWKAEWWRSQGPRRKALHPNLQEGLTAYATKQARILEGLAKTFATHWYPELAGANVDVEWPGDLLPDLG